MNGNMNYNPQGHNMHQPPQPPMQPTPSNNTNKKYMIIILSAVLAVVITVVVAVIIVVMRESNDNGKEKKGDDAAESTSIAQTTENNGSSQNGQGETLPNNNSDEPQGGMTKAEFVAFLNAETAKAANGSYSLNRKGELIRSVDVGDATELLNDVISGFIDPNETLDSVVGSFFDINEAPETGTVTNGKANSTESKYLLKAMNIEVDDVIGYVVQGNQYAIQIKNSKNPNSGSPLAHATDDYVSFSAVNKEIDEVAGNIVELQEKDSTANYTMITVVATIEDGVITEISYSYTLRVDFKLSVTLVSVNGSLEADVNGTYSNIQYSGEGVA